MKLDTLSLKDLQALKDKIAPALERAKERERTALKAKITELAAQSGLTIHDIMGTRKKWATNVSKYVNPDDRSQRWTGHGRRPNWLVSKLAKGATRDQFAV